MNQNEMKESHHIINITWFFFVSTQLEWKTKDLKNEWYEWILNDNVFEYYEFGSKVIATIISNIILFYIQKKKKNCPTVRRIMIMIKQQREKNYR